MPFLQIGSTVVPVQQEGGAERLEDERMGDERRVFDGTLVSSLRTPKKAWKFTTRPLSNSEVTALETAVGTLGANVTVSGDALGSSHTCKVLIEGYDYVADGAGFQRIATLSIRQV